MNAILALEDGTWYRGVAAGATGEAHGEVVFNTSMTGYQEVLTDPSYAGQIVTMTAPQIGNYGVAAGDESPQAPQVAGLHHAGSVAGGEQLESRRQPARLPRPPQHRGHRRHRHAALTRVLRSAGVMRGVIAHRRGGPRGARGQGARDSQDGRARTW
jgi:carbamoyl-phosphate synthase small subunit